MSPTVPWMNPASATFRLSLRSLRFSTAPDVVWSYDVNAVSGEHLSIELTVGGIRSAFHAGKLCSGLWGKGLEKAIAHPRQKGTATRIPRMRKDHALNVNCLIFWRPMALSPSVFRK